MNETEQLLEQVADHVRHAAQGHGKPLPAPLATGEFTHAARILGFALPPLLAALYTRVGDGGFGPEQGLLPLRQAVRTYEAQRGSGWRWPEGVLPIATPAAKRRRVATFLSRGCEREGTNHTLMGTRLFCRDQPDKGLARP